MSKTFEQDAQAVQKQVRDHYARAIEKTTVRSSCGCSNGCCGDSGSSSSDAEILYGADLLEGLPADVTDISFGCGDPVTLASLQPGQTVVDLGSGGGIDCFIAARKVGPTGKVIGVDMTPQMIDRARANKQQMDAANVEFRLGEIEHLPVADASVDVVISNCVINLSTDKAQVFSEIARVLKPGGRLAVSDIVTDGELPEAVKNDLSAWAGCVSGAVDIKDYAAGITKAGLRDVKITPVYLSDEMIADAVNSISDEAVEGVDFEKLRSTIYSAKITAKKP